MGGEIIQNSKGIATELPYNLSSMNQTTVKTVRREPEHNIKQWL
jgi:hypothetical protein